MAQQTINVGTSPNDGTGTPLRTAFQYTNSNFTELYTAVGPSGNNIVVPGSATITGDLTVDTSTLKVDSANNRVGIGTATPSTALEVATASTNTRFRINSTEVVATEYFRSGTGLWLVGSDSTNAFKIARGSNFGGSADYFAIASADAAATWYDAAGGTRMTLNSTGLGVGGSPINKLTVTVAPGTSTSDGLRVTDSTRTIIAGQTGATYSYLGIGGSQNLIYTSGARLDIVADGQSLFLRTGTANYLNLDSSGNVGVGVTPSGWSWKALQVGAFGGFLATNSAAYASYLGNNCYYDGTAWKYIASSGAVHYEIAGGDRSHKWYNAATGTAGNNITWTQAMTLDASGRLFVGATSITAGYTGNNYFVVGGVTSPTIKLQSTTGPAAWDIYSAGGLDLFLGYNAVDKGQFSRTTGAYTALSDANKKKDFEPSNIGLAEVLKLKPTLFRMIGAADDSAKELGFVAQDVQSVIPQAYVEAESQGGKFIGLQDRPIIAALTRAIQELTARVEALEA